MSPADGRGEVGVEGCGQAVMVVFGGGAVAGADVDGLRHAAGGHDAHQLVEIGVVRPHSPVQRLRKRLQENNSG